MRKVTKAITGAFAAGHSLASSNSSVIANGAIVGLYLHGNLIAERNKETGTLKITNAGWQSNVTKERLNGLPNVSICQKNYCWYLNGKEWNGQWVTINSDGWEYINN